MTPASRSLATRHSPLATLLLAIVFFFIAIPVFAQVQTGTPPFGSFGGGPDVINLANLNAHIDVPVFNKPGRGTNFTYDLSYDTSVWYPVTANGSTSWQPVLNWGWRGVTEVATGYVSFNEVSFTCYSYPHIPSGFREVWSNWTYHDTFGVLHIFPGTSQIESGTCGSTTRNMNAVATDGSGYTLQTANGAGTVTIISKVGKFINPPYQATSGAATAVDRNGNEISVNGSGVFTDTLGTTALTVAGNAPSPTTFTYTAPSGGSAAYTMKYSALTVQTKFACSGVTDYGPTSNDLVTEIDLPDGSKYTFTYEPTPGASGNVTGRLASVILPTGGKISYTYTGGNNGIVCADGSTAGLQRSTPDTGSNYWNYARTAGTGAAYTTTVTDPSGNATVIQFQGIYETQRQTYQGSTSGTLLQTVSTCYNTATSPCTGTAITLPITQRTVIDQYGSSGLQCKHNFLYNTFGDLTEQDDYDYGSGAPGALLRKTLVTFASLGNITAFRQQVTVQNGSGTVAQTNYNYDETTPTATSGIAQHTSVSGSRGNLTSINYPVSGLTAHFTYYDTGSISTQQDVNSATTTYNYSSTSASCQMAFPTSVSEPLSMSQSFTWNCTGGVPTSSTDENSQVTTATWNDANFWRPASIAFPDGGQTSWAYNSETSVTSTTKMNSSQNIVATQLLDGLGRNKEQQVNSDPEGVVYQDSTCDALGRLYTVSNPYRSTSDPTYGLTTYAYDALSRTTAVTLQDGSVTSASYSNNTVTVADPAAKKRTNTYDSLGRLTQVTEDPSGLGYVTTYSYDALGDLTAVTQNGSRQRNYVYDALSRLTSETNPESGTITYGYDASGHTGDLTSKVAPAPNQTGSSTVTTTYAYDLLHRLTSKTYSDGTDSAQYLYDTANTNGVTLANPIGRLSRSNTSIVESLYSYDPMGRVVTDYQTTPQHNSLAFGLTYNYDLAGDITSFANGIGVTLSYTLDGAGRPTQMTGIVNPPQYPATLITTDSANGYFPSGALRKATFGNSLTTTNVFNNRLQPCRVNTNSSSTLLQTCTDSIPTGNVLDLSLGYNSGTTNNGNVITWNATGQQSFARTFAYDSLNRLSTMGDTASAQVCKGLSWTYDPWGNRTDQTVTSGSCVSFHQSVNTQNRLVGPPYVYDAAGNLTNDGSHTYTYDAENRLIQVDGTVGNCSTATACYLYDAEGRRVEKNTPSGYKDYLYDLARNVTGEWLVVPGFTGQGAHYAYFAGQLVAEYENSTTYFVHGDHLGSVHLITGVDQSIKECNNFLPFGESDTDGCSVTADQAGQTHKFTSDERDAETGQDHTEFRQYASSLGRWITPDPAGLAAVDINNPQSLNRYSYVQNNPLVLIDPLGLSCQWDDGTVDAPEDSVEGGDPQACQDAGGTWQPDISPNNQFDPCMQGAICVDANGNNPPDGSGGGNPGIGDQCAPPFACGNSSGSTTWLQTKVFFQALGRNFIDEFKPGGCVAAFAEGADKADFLGAIPPGQPIIEDAIKGTAATVAANYAATQALTVPLRSSVVRGILATGATTAAYVAPVYLLGLTVNGAITEGKAIVNGTCH